MGSEIVANMKFPTGLGLSNSTIQSDIVNQATEPTSSEISRHVVLIGASIGQEWNLSGLSNRMNETRYTFESLQAWQFDKSALIDETLMRPARKFRLTAGYLKSLFTPSPQPPDMIILKECSSYFPGDMRRNKELVQGWVRAIKRKNIGVILATVVPVTKERAHRDPGKQEGIREFNNWLREFAGAQGVPLLDLEGSLSEEDKDKYLRDEFTSGDGSHLNRKAYDILDGLLVKTLRLQDSRQ